MDINELITIENIITHHLNEFYQSNYSFKNLSHKKIIKIDNLNYDGTYNFSLFRNNEHVFDVFILDNPSFIYYELSDDYLMKLNLKRMELTFLNKTIKKNQSIFKSKKNSLKDLRQINLFNELKNIHIELIHIISLVNYYLKMRLKRFNIDVFSFSNHYFLNFLSSVNNDMSELALDNFLLTSFKIDEDDFIKKHMKNFNNLFSFLNSFDNYSCSSISIEGKSVSLKDRLASIEVEFAEFLFNYYKKTIPDISYQNTIPISNFYHKQIIKDGVDYLLSKESELLNNNEYLLLSKDYFYNYLLDIINIIDNMKEDKIVLYNEIISNEYCFSFIKEKYIEQLIQNMSLSMLEFKFTSSNILQVFISKSNSVFYEIDIEEKTFQKTINHHILFKGENISNTSALYAHLKKELRQINKYFISISFEESIEKELDKKYKYYLIKNKMIINIKGQ